jgi:hypothetical protein
LKAKGRLNVIIGSSDLGEIDRIAQCEFDNTTLPEVKYWAFRANKWFHQDGFIILQSSVKHYRPIKEHGKIIYTYTRANYHVVFNRPVRLETASHIRAWLGLESGNEGTRKYALMQDIKQSSTIRLG